MDLKEFLKISVWFMSCLIFPNLISSSSPLLTFLTNTRNKGTTEKINNIVCSHSENPVLSFAVPIPDHFVLGHSFSFVWSLGVFECYLIICNSWSFSFFYPPFISIRENLFLILLLLWGQGKRI